MKQHTIADDLAAGVRSACLGLRVARLDRVVARLYEQGTAEGGTHPAPDGGSRRPYRRRSYPAGGLWARRRVGRLQDPDSHLHARFEAQLLVEAARADVLHGDVQERAPPARTDVVHE
jgi:hypothetical protein